MPVQLGDRASTPLRLEAAGREVPDYLKESTYDREPLPSFSGPIVPLDPQEIHAVISELEEKLLILAPTESHAMDESGELAIVPFMLQLRRHYQQLADSGQISKQASSALLSQGVLVDYESYIRDNQTFYRAVSVRANPDNNDSIAK